MNAPSQIKKRIDSLNEQELKAVLAFIEDINTGKSKRNKESYKVEALSQIQNALKSKIYLTV